MDAIEPVDVSAVAALERAADQGLPSHAAAAAEDLAARPLPDHAAAEAEALDVRNDPEEAPAPKAPDPTLTPVWTVGADGKLEAFVKETAVNARLARMEATLAQMARQVRHTMLLTMIFCDRVIRVSRDEYAAADQRVAETDRQVQS